MRYGHLNFRSLSKLYSQDLVSSFPKATAPEKTCAMSLLGKQPRQSFNSNVPMKSTELLNVVYSDVGGPFEVPSLGGNKYFITFIDEYSTMTWLFLIKMKNEAFKVFKRFKILAEKQSGKVKHSYDGG